MVLLDEVAGSGLPDDDHTRQPKDAELPAIVSGLNRSFHSYIDACMTPYGVSGTLVPLLAYLYRSTVHETQNMIARDLGVDKGTVSRNVQSLVRLGLATQTCSSKDSRACTVELTERGRRLGRMADQASQRWRDAACGGMSDEAQSMVTVHLSDMLARGVALEAQTPRPDTA